MTQSPRSLGGYLELELGARSAPPHAGAIALQSATMPGVPDFERHLYDECIPLPCGQGCEPEDLARVVAAIDAHVA